MKRVTVVAIFLFCFSMSAAGVSSQTKTNIAVSDLSGQSVDQASATIISDRLRTELFNTGIFKVLERQSMQDILKEQGFQQSGCTSDQCMVEIGQLLGVSRIISGTVGKLGGMFTLNIRMIDVKTGEIVYTTSVDCRCEIEDVLTKSVPSIAGKIATSVGKPVAAVTETPPALKAARVSLPPAKGFLRIQTDPPGAKIFMDNSDMGLTPFSNDSIGSGSHKIRIELDSYDQLVADISVFSGQTVNKTFNLKHAKAWKDSVESAHRVTEMAASAGKPKKKHSIIPKIVFGLLAAGSGAAGVVFNNLEQGKINDNATLKQQYVSSAYSNTSYYQSEVNNNATSAKKFNTMRNSCYIAACVCAAGFTISFAF